MIVFSDERYTLLQPMEDTPHTRLLRCFDIERSKAVLVRIFRTDNDAEKSLLLTEASAVRKLNHPALATIYDVGTTPDEYPFFSFEDVGGIPLHQAYRVPDVHPFVSQSQLHTQSRETRLIDHIIVPLQPVLSVLAHLHSIRRTARCVSPASLRCMLPAGNVPSATKHDNSKHGDSFPHQTVPLARLALDEWHPTGSITQSTSQPYNAPELHTGRLCDGRVDLYALGVSCYEALTGSSFLEIAAIEASGMVPLLLLNALERYVPALPHYERNILAQWLAGLVEKDRSMRFLSAREAAQFFVDSGLLSSLFLDEVPDAPSVLAPVYPVGADAALSAVANVHMEESELPVLELAAEAGLGKTMVLRSLVRGSAPKTPSFQQGQHWKTTEMVSAAECRDGEIVSSLKRIIENGLPTLLLIDDAEALSEQEREEVRTLLAAAAGKHNGSSGEVNTAKSEAPPSIQQGQHNQHKNPTPKAAHPLHVVAAHRTQLPVLSGKSHSFALARFAPNQLPLMCAEMLGRCAFTSDFYKDIYAVTKGHPLFVEELLRFCVRDGVIVRNNRLWHVVPNGTPLSAPSNPRSQSGSANSDSANQVFSAHERFPASLQFLLADYIRSLSHQAQQLLAVLAANASTHGNSTNGNSTNGKNAPERVPLYELAETLDLSTQAIMRILLPLAFDGYVQFEQATASLAHELYKEAVVATLPELVAHYCGVADEVDNYTDNHHTIHHIPQQVSQQGDSHSAVGRTTYSSQDATNKLTEQPSEKQRSDQHHEPHAPTVFAQVEQSLELPAVLQGRHPSAPPAASTPNSSLSEAVLQTGIFVGTSHAVAQLRRQVILAAQYDVPALLEGPLGSGKEEIAGAIHRLSKRNSLLPNALFQIVVCSDFHAQELERYLFGNGLTGQDNALLSQIQGGTLFIDDIIAAPQSVQAKLARIAQQRVRSQPRASAQSYAQGLPSNAQQHSAGTFARTTWDVRLIIGYDSTSTGLPEQAVQEGRLHPELFFAVSSLRIHAPSLEERRTDIPALATYFYALALSEFGDADHRLTHQLTLPNDALAALQQRRWAGNIIELESLMRRLALSPDSNTMLELLQREVLQSDNAVHNFMMKQPTMLFDSSAPLAHHRELYHSHPNQRDAGEAPILSIDEAQKEHILRALELTQGNKTKAAQMLRIKRTTLLARMKKFGMMP